MIYRPPYRYRTINAHFSVIGYWPDIFKPVNNALFPSETLKMCAVMVLKCLKYDWNHFEKDNTLKCNMCRASLS